MLLYCVNDYGKRRAILEHAAYGTKRTRSGTSQQAFEGEKPAKSGA